MGIKRALSLAGLALAGGMITGCWGDCWCTGGSATGTQPKSNQTTTATSSLGQQPSGWNNQPAADSIGARSSLGTQLAPSMPATGQNSLVGGQSIPTTSSATTATGNSVDTMPSMPSPVRTVSGTWTPPAATSNLNPPQPVVPPPLTQRDTLQPSGALAAPQPPSLPPQPPTLPATTSGASSTSKYIPTSPPTSQQLPPEAIPGQSKIPTLPPGPTPVD